MKKLLALFLLISFPAHAFVNKGCELTEHGWECVYAFDLTHNGKLAEVGIGLGEDSKKLTIDQAASAADKLAYKVEHPDRRELAARTQQEKAAVFNHKLQDNQYAAQELKKAQVTNKDQNVEASGFKYKNDKQDVK